MLIQTIFDRMMIFDNTLGLESGGDDVSRGLIVCDMVSDWMEAEAATIEGCLGTHNLLYTAENTETTDWPERLLRLDSLWYIDASTGRPVWELDPIQGVGNHVPGMTWPLSEMVLSGSAPNVAGKPKEYAATGPGGQFYWVPMPDAEYWIRGYGLWSTINFESADSIFPFPSTVSLPFSGMASYLMKIGLDRELTSIETFVRASLRPVLKGLKKFNKTMPDSRVYSEVHDA